MNFASTVAVETGTASNKREILIGADYSHQRTRLQVQALTNPGASSAIL
jgi:hypothetical protein